MDPSPSPAASFAAGTFYLGRVSVLDNLPQLGVRKTPALELGGLPLLRNPSSYSTLPSQGLAVGRRGRHMPEMYEAQKSRRKHAKRGWLLVGLEHLCMQGVGRWAAGRMTLRLWPRSMQGGPRAKEPSRRTGPQPDSACIGAGLSSPIRFSTVKLNCSHVKCRQMFPIYQNLCTSNIVVLPHPFERSRACWAVVKRGKIYLDARKMQAWQGRAG